MRVGFLARKSARPGAGRHTVPCNRRGARGRVNEQIAGLWTSAPRKLKTVNQWRIRRVPTSARQRLTSRSGTAGCTRMALAAVIRWPGGGNCRRECRWSLRSRETRNHAARQVLERKKFPAGHGNRFASRL